MAEETTEKTAAAEKTTVGTAQNTQKSENKLPLIIAAVVIVLVGLICLFVWLDAETTGRIRDTMLVIYVLESIVSLTALVVLIVQITKLVNFLKYELHPILDTTQKTVNKISGTVSFLCENAVEPTINSASTVSGIKNAANSVLSIFKK